MSTGAITGWIRQPFDGRRAFDLSSISCRRRNPFFRSLHSHWLPVGPEVFPSKVQVAADFSDSVPDSSRYVGNQGYHPLEDVKDHERKSDMTLTDAEIARTTVEANSNALLVFPGMVHCEPHKHVSWREFQYVMDDYGDIYFEIFDDENILQDPSASNPVTVLIGMDTPFWEHIRMMDSYHDSSFRDSYLDVSFSEDHDKVTEVSDTLIGWGMPDTLPEAHPVYFAKCLTKAVQAKYAKKIDSPSNGISIVGCLRPAFIDEESYLRRLFRGQDNDGYISDWRDKSEKEDEQVAVTSDLNEGEILHFNLSARDRSSTFYNLEIVTMDLFSLYGDKSMISLPDFQNAEPDILAHSASRILERLSDRGTQCNAALKALCRKKKGLIVEEASLIGVDSLGMDVRVFSGVEAQTLRFSFNARALTVSAAEKKIWRMLFPRYHRKNLKIPNDGFRDNE